MSPQEAQAVLDDQEAPNTPAKLPGGGLSGSREYVDPQKARERRAAMSAAFMQGASRDAIMATFTDPNGKYRLSEQQVQHLMQETRAQWDDEDAEAVRHYRGAARRRLLNALQEARKDRKWTAYFAGEKVLAEVEGTSVHDNGGQLDSADARFTDAVLAVLASKDQGELRVIIERQRTLVEITPKSGVEANKARRIVSGGG